MKAQMLAAALDEHMERELLCEKREEADHDEKLRQHSAHLDGFRHVHRAKQEQSRDDLSPDHGCDKPGDTAVSFGSIQSGKPQAYQPCWHYHP